MNRRKEIEEAQKRQKLLFMSFFLKKKPKKNIQTRMKEEMIKAEQEA